MRLASQSQPYARVEARPTGPSHRNPCVRQPRVARRARPLFPAERLCHPRSPATATPASHRWATGSPHTALRAARQRTGGGAGRGRGGHPGEHRPAGSADHSCVRGGAWVDRRTAATTRASPSLSGPIVSALRKHTTIDAVRLLAASDLAARRLESAGGTASACRYRPLPRGLSSRTSVRERARLADDRVHILEPDFDDVP